MTLCLRAMALVLALASLDAGGQGALPRTIADVLARVEAAGEPPGAPAARAVLAQPVPANAPLEFHLARAAAAAELGHPALLLAERRRIVELTEGERNQPKHLLDLAIVELTAGNWADAQAFTQRAASASTAYYGQDVAATALLARMQSWLGDVSNARTATDLVEAQFRRARISSGAVPYVELVGALIMWAKADTLLAEIGRAHV